MKKKILMGFLLVASLASAARTSPMVNASKPNVIVILTDDQGYGDLAAYGLSDDLKTPHIDALAKDGVIFTEGYVTSPQCAPSRAGLMMGRHNQRIGFDTIPDGPLPLEEVTLAERMHDAGYTTGHVGKWHLEPNHVCVSWAEREHPELIQKRGKQNVVKLPWELVAKYQSGNQGFDDFFSGEVQHYWRNFDRKGKDLKQSGEHKRFPASEFRIDVQTDAALAFIDRNHDQPFFLYLNYYAPHMPLVASKEYLSRFPGKMSERRRYALAMMAAMDDGVGAIREKLSDYGVDENTIIFYLSDNGAPLGAQGGADKWMDDLLPVTDYAGAWDGSNNGMLTGEKGTLMEGGIRVPFLVSWPAKLPKGQSYDEPVSSLDITPTCLAAAGQAIPAELDGIDIFPFLTGKTVETRTLFWRFWNQAAIRQGDMKYFYLSDGRQYLVNLKDDPQEQHNLIAQYPELTDRMKKDLTIWTNELQPKGLPTDAPNVQEKGWFEYYLKNQTK
ncbi:sulfatase family protein [Coraliomargarita sp. W4R72]